MGVREREAAKWGLHASTIPRDNSEFRVCAVCPKKEMDGRKIR